MNIDELTIGEYPVMSEELKPCPFCGCEADFDEDSGDGVTCAKTEGSCGFYFNNDGGWTRKEVAALWNRRAAPEPAQSDRERASKIVTDNPLLFRGQEHDVTVDLIASEFAAVRDAATKAERERCAKRADRMAAELRERAKGDAFDGGSFECSANDLEDYAETIRKGEP